MELLEQIYKRKEDNIFKQKILDALTDMVDEGLVREVAAVVLHDIWGHPNEEIAAYFGVSETESRRRIVEGRRGLLSILG